MLFYIHGYEYASSCCSKGAYFTVISHKSAKNPENVAGKGDYSSLDIVSWFQSQGLYLNHLEDNKHAVICPWQHEHTVRSQDNGGDTIIFEADGGWPGFYCHHHHCEDRRIKDVMILLGDADEFCHSKW